MSKVKPPKKLKGTPNKHLHARTAFLYQAATYLTLQNALSEVDKPDHVDISQSVQADQHPSKLRSPLALELGFDLQQVSRKAQLRLSIDLKRSMCKSCNAILIPGRTATQTMENLSRGGKKPWADVLVVQCDLCGGKKRFPVGAEQQAKQVERKACLEMVISATPQSDSAPLSGTDVGSVTAYTSKSVMS
jgi:ribonuclease P protein subunit RPR2